MNDASYSECVEQQTSDLQQNQGVLTVSSRSKLLIMGGLHFAPQNSPVAVLKRYNPAIGEPSS
jgi:hypothetical protein